MADILDISKILNDYSKQIEDDFGFSAVSEEEYNSVISESEQTVESYKKKLAELEKLVPFFMKLLKTADKEYIYWPNRKAAIEEQIKKILTVTRS
jgi:translation initiation factor 2B subunit (eIF-2B alpha/beta/delta family)